MKNKDVRIDIYRILCCVGVLPLLLFITERRPLNGVLEAVICIAFLFGSLASVSELFRRLPLLRKIV